MWNTLLGAVLGVSLVVGVGAAQAQDTAFTYQGSLSQDGTAADGQFDMTFQLWTAASGGSQVGSTVSLANVPVGDGLFAAQLDFGAVAFDNAGRWLQVSVEGSTLSPRQPITRSPYSIQTRGIFVDDNELVGIGTSSPFAQLHIDGSGSSSPALHITAPGNSSGEIAISSPAGTTGVIGWEGVNGNRRDVRFMETGLGLFTSDSSNMPQVGHGLFINEEGYVGIGTIEPTGPLHAEADTDLWAILGKATGASQYGVYGLSEHASGRGVFGYATEPDGTNYGVYGRTNSDHGTGVFGWTTSRLGRNSYGVFGRCDGQGYAMYAHNTYTSSSTHWGLYAQVDGAQGRAIEGACTSAAGNNFAIYGHTMSPNGAAIYGVSRPTTGTGRGIVGSSSSSSGYDFYADGAGINYGSPSSVRWKHNISAVKGPLDKLQQIRGVYYDWDEEHGGGRDIGFIGEEVGEVVPEIVAYEEDGKFVTGMDYGRMTPLLVEAVKELKADHDQELDQLRSENQELRRRLAALEEMMGVMLSKGAR